MKLYNKGKREIIVAKSEVIEGGRKSYDGSQPEKVWFSPDTIIEVSEALGNKLLGLYPKEMKNLEPDKPAVEAKEEKTVGKQVVEKKESSSKGKGKGKK